MTRFGIISYGAYVPRKRISRKAIFDAVGWAQPSLKGLARGARAYAAWDEDAITMGAEAARRATASFDGGVETLCFASTTAPFLDRQNAGVVAAALDLPGETHCFDMAGSQRAGVSALIAAGRDGAGLVVAADRRPTKSASVMEMLSGDGAAALVVGPGEPCAEIVGFNSVYSDFVDHYRTAASKTDYTLEERWFREAGLGPMLADAVGPLLQESGVGPEDIAHFIAPTANPALASAAAKAVGVGKETLADSLFETCGHAGAAHPLLMLTTVLDQAKPGALVLLTALGQGCDAVLLRVTDRIQDMQARPAPQDNAAVEENYMRFLAAHGGVDIDWGMRAERDNRTAQTVAYNKSRDVYGFVGGLCSACGTPQFPKSRRCVNPDCGALDTQTDYRFADRRGRIKSFTEDWLAFTREPPLIYGNVSFDGGGNVFMEMTDFAPGEAAIGAPLTMRFRIKDIDAARGFHRYFWKAARVGGAHG